MDSSEKSDHSSKERRTRVQLQKELDKVQDALKKQEVELTEYKKELQQAQDKITSLEEKLEQNCITFQRIRMKTRI